MTHGEQIAVRTGAKTTALCVVDGPGTCRSCGADVYWVKTPADRPMPVDPPEDGEGITTSHFATCPHADEHRRPRVAS